MSKRDRREAPSTTFGMHTAVVLVLCPILLAIVVVCGWSNYRNLKRVILEGFDRKLVAVSSSTAAFLDGDVHDRMRQPRLIPVIAADRSNHRILGIDVNARMLVVLDPETGVADDLVGIDDGSESDRHALEVRGLAVDGAGEAAYVLGADQRTISRIELATGRMQVDFTLPEQVVAIATSGIPDSLSALGERLMTVSTSDGTVRSAKSLPKALREGGSIVAFDDVDSKVHERRYLGLWRAQEETSPRGWMEFDGAMNEITELSLLTPPPPTEGEGESENVGRPQVTAFAWLAPDKIWGTDGNRLYALDPSSGAVRSEGFAPGFSGEPSKAYQRYVRAMRRIREYLGLTYHYTLTLPSQNEMTYVLDSTETEDHSEMGTNEEVEPEEWQRLQNVLATGRTSLSDVKYFELWGLLKVGNAPIRNHLGKVVGMVGADVNISVIEQKTRVVLLQVLSIGTLALLVAMLVASIVARSLLKPIELLKRMALRVAAGKYDVALSVRGPSELRVLAERFETIRKRLQTTVDTLGEENQAFERHRSREELAQYLRQGDGPSAANGKSNRALVVQAGPHHPLDPSGWVEHDGRILLWISTPANSSLEAAKVIADLRRIAVRMLSAHRTWRSLERELEPLYRDVVSLFLVLDERTGEIGTICRDEKGAVVRKGESTERCSLRTFRNRTLEPGAIFLFSTSGESDLMTMYAECFESGLMLRDGETRDGDGITELLSARSHLEQDQAEMLVMMIREATS